MKKNNDQDSNNYSLFLKASSLLESGQSKRAFALFLEAASNGDASSQHNVGFMYDVGKGVKRDPTQAIFWYKNAWRNDRQTGTCCNIASLYESLGQARKAVYWWNKAVLLGDGDAALDLAKYLLKRQKNQSQQKAKIIELLKMTIQSEYATPDCVDEAKSLLLSLENVSK